MCMFLSIIKTFTCCTVQTQCLFIWIDLILFFARTKMSAILVDISPKYRLSVEVDTISSTDSWLEEILGVYR